MTIHAVTIDDKYDLGIDRVFVTGTQALVRAALMQHERDRQAGLNTGGYVTGYRGSPLGGVDQQFERARNLLAPRNIIIAPGLNEDLAATALWGTQQAEMRGEGRFHGVFGMWYGKGPGVDRCGDVFRHANLAGSSQNGGVIVLMGDDHNAESSTCAHQSEFAMLDAMIPVLNPAGVQEIYDYALIGIAMSRFCGTWVGVKCVHDNVESSAVIEAGRHRLSTTYPADFPMPEGGLNIRPADDRYEQERRLHRYKRPAAVAFARANRLDRVIFDGGDAARVGIITAGKSYLDVRQALSELTIDESATDKLGLRLLKLALTWPVEPRIVREFADGLDVILVVEEKRAFIETHVKDILLATGKAPRIIGKLDQDGAELLPAFGVLEPNIIARAIGDKLLGAPRNAAIEKALAAVRTTLATDPAPDLATRLPYFCAGCPHNSSTVIPEDARGYAGIGCHWMVQSIPERNTEGSTQMGGEGANWIGEAPFSTRGHVFQNIGDGTYNHSGLQAVRAAIAANVNITYKILYNDAVAMTGGQGNDGPLSVAMIARQMRACGAGRIVVISDEPGKYRPDAGFPPQTSFYHRDDIQAVQRNLGGEKGVSILIYDQTCAAEKRRRRKRGAYPDPNRRVFINELVCEGCGDCGVKSNCVAIMPSETEFGRKRQIDQSACNKDYSCLKGFCPSFVTIEGGRLLAQSPRDGSAVDADQLPRPREQHGSDRPWAILITGIGGTGIVTVGHVLGMAAHIEGKRAALVDMVGLSQKNGAVVTHIKIAHSPGEITAVRIAANGADLVLGCDLVTAASSAVMATCSPARTHAVVNSHEVMSAEFTRNADFRLPTEEMKQHLSGRIRTGAAHFIDATEMATALVGDPMAANMFLLGYAYQMGLMPVGPEAIERAIELNGVAVEMNINAFRWGRRVAHDPSAAGVMADWQEHSGRTHSLGQLIERRADFLADYQNQAYAESYRKFVDKVRLRESGVQEISTELTAAVARYLFKLMAYKDEYEVARLYTNGDFQAALAARFAGGRLTFHLAPPLLAKRDAVTGELRKRKFGPWMLSVFKLLASMRFLRGTAFDIFGRSKERRRERSLIEEYRTRIDALLPSLTAAKIKLAVEIASLPEQIRGFGHVKQRHLVEVDKKIPGLLASYHGSEPAPRALAAE
jgi:indolepyruvate ferredoxin oxidoreductase